MLLWLLLTSTINGSEAIGGVGASCVAATLAELARRRGVMRFAPRARWLGFAAQVPVQIVTDTILVYGALLRHVSGQRRARGTLRAVPFAYGREGSPRDSARRALAIVGISMTPNTFVIGVDPDSHELLVHQLVPRPDSVPRLLGRA
jgi:multisubunit Na+/H+ antiporter MnhE subunit